MGTVIVNDIEIEVGPKDNLVQAAEHAGVEIPHYCWHPDLSVVASCRMCLVEVGEKKPDGTVAMLPRLVPACQTPAKPGTVVRTDTPKVKNAQAQTLEYLLLNHPLDCSICDQAGECYLQDYTYKFGNAQSRLHEPKVQREDKYHIGDQIALFTDRCVMCTRCVRFTREYSGTSELQVISRGSVEEIDVFDGIPCNNKLAGNVVDLCPVGALCSKDFLYKKRVWWLKSQDSVCTRCSTGCSIKVDQNEDRIYRLRPRENHQAQGAFMCDDGRFGWKYVHSEDRLLGPRLGRLASTTAQPGLSADGNGRGNGKGDTLKLSKITPPPDANDLGLVDPWPEVLKAVRSAIKQAVARDAQNFIGVFSPMMTCEEAFLLAKFLRSVHRQIRLVLGPVPVFGEDDCYPKGPRGESPAADKTRFTIRAEKCPNRRGVERVLQHFQGEVIALSDLEPQMANEEMKGVYWVGGYPDGGLSDSQIQIFSRVECLIVQDFGRSKMSDAATILLASATFAEREGTVVNHADLAQLIRPAVRSPGDARPDGRLLMELAERRGLFHAGSIRQEMAREIPAFAGWGNGDLGELGVFLKQPETVMA